MLGRLKFDLDKLANELLDNMPEDVFTSNTSTFIDPAMGGGQFIKAVITRLRKYGHSDKNITSRVFGYETNKMRVNFAKKQCQGVGTFTAVNFLDLKLEIDMKFDVVIGNPPYQDGDNPSAKLWNRFVEKSTDLTKDDGILSMIHPLVWMKRPNGQASDKIVKNIFSQYQLIYVDATATKYFNVDEEVSSYIMEKTKRYKVTEFKFLDRTEFLEYTGQKLCLTVEEKIALSIYNKITNYEGEKLRANVWCDYGGDATIEQRIERGDFTVGVKGKNTQPVFWTAANNNYYFANPEKSKKGIKIIINRSGYYYVKDNIDKYIKLDLNNQYAVGVAGYALSFKTEENARNCLSYLTSKLYAWFVEYEKSGGYNTGVPKLGYLDVNKTWNNNDVYNFYKLTKEEIEYIETRFK